MVDFVRAGHLSLTACVPSVNVIEIRIMVENVTPEGKIMELLPNA